MPRHFAQQTMKRFGFLENTKMTDSKLQNKRNHTGHRVGAWHHNAVVSEDKVKQARKMRESGLTMAFIARALNINYWTLVDICNYKTRTFE